MVHVQLRSDDPEENLKQLQAMERFFYGSKLIRKADADVSPTTAAYATGGLPDWVQPIYGRKVWSFLNYDENVFAVIPKERWLQSGWRMLTEAAQAWPHTATEQVAGVARDGTLPETISPTIQVNATQPKELMHTWGVAEIDAFLSSVDDSIDILPFVREELGKEHAAILNVILVQSAHAIAETAGATAWTGTDNFESLDRIISSDAEEDALTAAGIDHFDPWKKYGLTENAVTIVDRDDTTTFDSVVRTPAGVPDGSEHDLTLSGMDTVWRTIIENGGMTDVILTGADYITALSEILEPERRFVGEAKILPQYGGVRGIAPGVEAGFTVATFRGIPMVATTAMRCQDTTYPDTISKTLWLDTEYLRLRIATPTRYLESERGYTGYMAQAANGLLRLEGGYLTVGELLCYRFNTQGKLAYIQ